MEFHDFSISDFFHIFHDFPDFSLMVGSLSLYATHPLMLVIICAKYGKIPLRIVDFFFKVKAEKFQKFAKIWNFQILKKT